MGVVSDTAKKSVFNWFWLSLFSTIIAATGLFSDFGFSGQYAVLFAAFIFTMPVILTLILKSFRKAVISLAPPFFAILWTLAFSGILGIRVEGISILFAAITLGIGSITNIFIVRDYFKHRRAPMTVARAVHSAFSENEKEVVGTSIVSILTFLFLSFSAELSLLSALSALSISFNLIATAVLLPPMINVYEFARERKALTKFEGQVRTYALNYGTNNTAPFIASWLGVAISDIERALEKLEAKGFLGPLFFVIDDPFLWFLLTSSFLLGGAMALQDLPEPSGFIKTFVSLCVLTIGICMEGPQLHSKMKKSARRTIGAVLILSSLIYVYSVVSFTLFELYLFMAALGLTSIHISRTGMYIISNITTSLFFGTAFSAGWYLYRAIFPPVIPLLSVIILSFTGTVLIEEEAYYSLHKDE